MNAVDRSHRCPSSHSDSSNFSREILKPFQLINFASELTCVKGSKEARSQDFLKFGFHGLKNFSAGAINGFDFAVPHKFKESRVGDPMNGGDDDGFHGLGGLQLDHEGFIILVVDSSDGFCSCSMIREDLLLQSVVQGRGRRWNMFQHCFDSVSSRRQPSEKFDSFGNEKIE